MKKIILLFLVIFSTMVMSACSKQDTEIDKTEEVLITQHEEMNTQQNDIKTTVSGSFTVGVRDVIPDYSSDNLTPNVAVVTEFQSYPFTIFVGEEIGSQLEAGEVYVFTIKPIVVDYPKEYLAGMNLSSLVWELPDFEITDFRLANENELGLESLCLTIE